MNESDIFMAALDRNSPQERAEFLDTACADNPQLRQRVETLLAAHSAAGSVFEHPAIGDIATQLLSDTAKRLTEDASSSRLPELHDIPLDFLSPSSQPGSLGRLGQYEVLEVVGRGGMGIVLRAQDTKLNRIVAVKVLTPELAANPTARKRFLREAQAAAAVSHDHVVTTYAVDENEATGRPNLPYLVMEFIDGQSLQQKLDREGGLPLNEILRIGRQIAAGLAAAHAQGLIHRDVKPSNILLRNGIQRVEITDFGLARAVDDVGMTRTGEVTGTPQYMSPEQAQGLPVDARSDLFSLGSVLYAMCTGRGPFRAETTVASLRRVCDDTPRPVHEVNPDIPDWLAAIIDRLLAKDPHDRFQTAEEVAELLEQHLAHLQAPGSTPLPGTHRPSPQRAAGRWQRWLVAALVLFVVAAGVGMTEATGVTRLAATVVRVLTGEGVLVIEVDDPSVAVSLNGKELIITGAGLREVKLLPGSYQLKATKDGEPVKQELVTIHRGDRQVVRVTREGTTPTLQGQTPSTPVERGAFVVLRPDGETSARVDTLADAVVRSSAGDTIEIRGNGPFVTGPIEIDAPLKIRAGKNYRPVIRHNPDSAEGDYYLLKVNRGPLVLEGLEIQNLIPESSSGVHDTLVLSEGDDAIYLANCRFLTRKPQEVCIKSNASLTIARNCEFTDLVWPAFWRLSSTASAEYVIENCVCSAGQLLSIRYPLAGDISLKLTRTTCAGSGQVICGFIDDQTVLQATDRIRVDASQSVFCKNYDVLNFSFWNEDDEGMTAEQQKDCIRHVISWSDDNNLFRVNDFSMIVLGQSRSPFVTLADWRRLWGSPADAAQDGLIKFVGGNPATLARNDLGELDASDFRLRPDSAGYQAGPDGKDLGADVDLVGPGDAFERWKKTPDYQQWLRKTNDLIAGAVADQSSSFVVLSSLGQEVGKFSSLNDAVLGSSSGDTIEIRGNGPFVTEPIEINRPLTIRAGVGFRPIIQDDLQRPDAGEYRIIRANAPIALEGLDFQARIGTIPPSDSLSKILESGASFSAANCRFVGPGMYGLLLISDAHIHNCEIFAKCAIHWDIKADIRLSDCLLMGGLGQGWADVSHEKSLRIKDSTCLSWAPLFNVAGVDIQGSGEQKLTRIVSSNTIFDSDGTIFVFTESDRRQQPLTVAEAEELYSKQLEWREKDNLYHCQRPYILKTVFGKSETMKSLAESQIDWNRFWNVEKSVSTHVKTMRYQGGALLTKALTNLEGLTPEDFRLRPDSAGYRAGPDGKDIGADVDLVGPGEAYERWKQTPEYQNWQKDTRQLISSAQAGEQREAKAD